MMLAGADAGLAGAWALAGTLVQLVHWVEKGHVLRPFKGQLCIGVIVYHFRDAVKHSACLVQCVFVVFCLSHYDVDTPLTSPGDKNKKT